MATSRPARSAAARIRAAVSACWAASPWAKLSLAMSMPALIICSSTGSSREEGPMVATIFVKRIRRPIYSCRELGPLPKSQTSPDEKARS